MTYRYGEKIKKSLRDLLHLLSTVIELIQGRGTAQDATIFYIHHVFVLYIFQYVGCHWFIERCG